MPIRLAVSPPVVAGAGAVQSTTASGTDGSSSSSLGRIPGTYGQDDLLPGGAKVRGGVIAPTTAIFWTDQDNVWSSSTQPRIIANLDRAVMLGCNVVEILGSISSMITQPPPDNYQGISRATYHARWDWVNAQCVARGLRMFPIAQIAYEYDHFSAIPVQFLKDEIAAWVQHINSYQNCIGIDVLDESTITTTPELRQSLYDLLKPLTALPLCFSFPGGTSTMTTNATRRNQVRAHSDFFNIHWYQEPAADQIEAGYWSQGETKPVLIGEFGAPSASVSIRMTRHTAILNAIKYVGASGRRPAGALVWTITGYTPTWTYGGIYKETGEYDAPIGDIFKQIPKT